MGIEVKAPRGGCCLIRIEAYDYDVLNILKSNLVRFLHRGGTTACL